MSRCWPQGDWIFLLFNVHNDWSCVLFLIQNTHYFIKISNINYNNIILFYILSWIYNLVKCLNINISTYFFKSIHSNYLLDYIMTICLSRIEP